VNSRSRSLYAIADPSVCRLSVCDVGAPQGRLHKGGNGARCTMAKSGGDFFNNGVFAIMYYYMNTFITLH